MTWTDFKRGMIGLTLLVALGGCQSTNGQTVWMGFLEGQTVDVSTEVGGRITSLSVEEGDLVQSGQPLLTIDDDLARLGIANADANVAAAQAQLALLQAGARPEDIRQAQARVTQARALLDGAAQALADAQAIRDNPQTLLIQKAQADANSQAAAQQLVAASRQAEAADLVHELWLEQVNMIKGGIDIPLPQGGSVHLDLSPNRLTSAQTQASQAGTAAWEAWAAVAQAQANATAAQAARSDITDQLKNPIALDSRVDQAQSARDRAAADLAAAQAALQVLQDGPSPAQVQAARAALDEARAARARLGQQAGNYAVDAPNAGTVSQVFYRSGEVASPGTALVRISLPGDLTLRVYIPMSTLALVSLGQQAAVSVEGIGNRTFEGTVTRIADQAEFSTRQAQTDSERNAQLVAVEITLKNPGGLLKAGMPASVSFK